MICMYFLAGAPPIGPIFLSGNSPSGGHLPYGPMRVILPYQVEKLTKRTETRKKRR